MQSEKTNSVISIEITRQKLRKLLRIVCVFLFGPLIVITLISLYIYHRLVEIVLRIQFKDKFVGFLKGTDCIWAIEDTVSLSVINILMILEKDARNSNAIFVEDFRNLVNTRIVSKTADTTLEKLFYRRSRKFGYYFWERSEEVDLKNRIRWLECEDPNCDGSCEDISSESFRKNLGSICNRSLPDDHTATWEILVGKRCPRSRSHIEEGRLFLEEWFDTDNREIPIIFRVHHSLGDGVALLGLLLKVIAEEDEAKVPKVTKIEDTISINENGNNFKGIVPPLRNSEIFQSKTEFIQSYEKEIITASMPFTYVIWSRILKDLQNHFRILLKCFKNITINSIKQQVKIPIERTWSNFEDVLTQVHNRIKEVARLIMILLSAPECLTQQGVHMDENALHGPPQTGEKVVAYWIENDIANNKSQKSLLMKIREIRKNTGAKFGDIILAAFSASIHRYHFRINKPAPDALTAIVPMRMAMPDEKMTLDNKFSVALLRICISKAGGQTIAEPNQDSQFFKRLQDIARANNELRKKPDFLLNFWIMKYLSAILPVKILRFLLLSHSTMVFSNICGPQKVRILNHSLSNIAFWVPNKGTTALGFSLLSYGRNLHLSLIADKSIIKDERFLTEILEDTVHEIDNAYNSITF